MEVGCFVGFQVILYYFGETDEFYLVLSVGMGIFVCRFSGDAPDGGVH